MLGVLDYLFCHQNDLFQLLQSAALSSQPTNEQLEKHLTLVLHRHPALAPEHTSAPAGLHARYLTIRHTLTQPAGSPRHRKRRRVSVSLAISFFRMFLYPSCSLGSVPSPFENVVYVSFVFVFDCSVLAFASPSLSLRFTSSHPSCSNTLRRSP